jgi:hypothetical protein
VRRTPALLALAVSATLTTAGLTATTATTAGAVGAPAAHRAARPLAKGGVGRWTKISRSTVATSFRASTTRDSTGVLHVIYPRTVTGGNTTLSHTALNTNGSIVRQNDVLADGWSTMDVSPIVLSQGTALRTVFVGMRDLTAGFWSDNQMYDATSPDAGSSWALPAEVIGSDNNLAGLYGMGATTLSDGTPVTATPLNGTISYHVGVGTTPDSHYNAPSGSIYDVTLARSGSQVWMSWFQSGTTPSTHGTFVMPIYPVAGSPSQAPGSSSNASSISTGRTALATRVGGDVFLAYCVGYPTCTAIKLWKVGTSKVVSVPGSKGAESLALSAGPSGRLWVAWYSNVGSPKMKAVRTGTTGLVMGAVRTVGIPRGTSGVYNVVVDGSRGRGDLVVNGGDAFWHTQVLAGLSLHASPSHWRHGGRQRVVFSVTDARAAVRGARVTVGSSHCSTNRRGVCSITFPASFSRGRHTASASHTGYAKAATTLRVS